jgi:hypothetical protein
MGSLAEWVNGSDRFNSAESLSGPRSNVLANFKTSRTVDCVSVAIPDCCEFSFISAVIADALIMVVPSIRLVDELFLAFWADEGGGGSHLIVDSLVKDCV